MSREISLRIERQVDIVPRLTQAEVLIGKGIQAGPVEVVLRRVDDKRSTQANRLMWKLLTDIADQIEWAGEKLSPESWKDLITASFRKQKIIPGLDGGLVALGARTSKMRKAEFSELIECIYSVGCERGVRWSADTQTDWAQYKEAAA